MGNLIEGMLLQANRCREVLKSYEEIPEGAFGARMIRESIAAAEAAMAGGDIVEMIKCYNDLESIK